MTKALIIFLLIIQSTISFGASKVVLRFEKDSVQQGSLVEAKMVLEASSLQGLELQKLKGERLGDILFIHKVSPIIKSRTEDNFQAAATVIFLKVPSNNEITHKLNGKELVLTWGNVSVEATEAKKEFTYETFSIPEKMRILFWVLTGIGFLIVGYIIKLLLDKQKKKRLEEQRRSDLRAELTNASNYEEVVAIWKNKQHFINEFPHLDHTFKSLEKVLFKHQFKQSQTEQEKSEVMKAYRDFVRDSEGGFNGV